MPAMTTPVSLATVQVADADFLQRAENKDFNETKVTVDYQLALQPSPCFAQVITSQVEMLFLLRPQPPAYI